jgi:hypothetical protein
MSKLGEKERKELRRRAFELHLQDDQLIAVGHVAIRSAMLDKLIDLRSSKSSGITPRP